MTGIVILNWNGWKDTIECLKSLYKVTDSEFFIILVDNGSTNESITQICQFLDETPEIRYYHISEASVERGELPTHTLVNKATILYSLNENYGFAKGNNIGLALAKQYKPKYLMMLNNDTEVEPDFLSKLVNFIKDYPQYTALCPKISLFYDKTRIWNCGGSLKWGFRKYHYGGKPEKSIKEKEYIDAEFVTGCAFFFRSSLIQTQPLLTEKFFHGEEDFELSLRFKKLNLKMACVLLSHVYHKVGLSTTSLNDIGKFYVHLLNRYINIRQHFNSFSFICWKYTYSSFILFQLIKKNYGAKNAFRFLNKLHKESTLLNGVDKNKFFEVLKNGV